MNFRLTLIALISSFILFSSYANHPHKEGHHNTHADQENPTIVKSCRLHFATDKTEVSEKHVLSCFSDVDPKAVRYFDILATASPDGPFDHNFKLSQERSHHAAEIIKKLFPGAIVNMKSGGVNKDLMRSVTIIAVLHESPITIIKEAKGTRDSIPCGKCECPFLKETNVRHRPVGYGVGVWVGIGKILSSTGMSTYEPKFGTNYEYGASYFIAHLGHNYDIHIATRVTMRSSRQDLPNVSVSPGTQFTAFVYKNDIGLLAQLNKRFYQNESGKNTLSWLSDLGPSLQTRALLIRFGSTFVRDYYVADTIGLMAGTGFKFQHRFAETHALFTTVRLGINAGLTSNSSGLLYLNGGTVNVNSPFVETSLAAGWSF